MTSQLVPARRVAALVPMRHHSERVPGKNFRNFCDRPLFHWVLDMLLSCHVVGEVVVDTDSEIIRHQCEEEFPSVRLIDRPIELRGDLVSMNEILLHDVAQIRADIYLQTHSTNPLLRVETVAAACACFGGTTAEHDSLFTVTRRHVRLWNAKHEPMNHNPKVLLRTQDLAPVFEENSCLFLFTRESLERTRNRIGSRPFLFEIDPVEAWDIDTERDFEIGQRLFEVTRPARGSR